MANRHPLSAEKREVFGKKVAKYRGEGKIPANIYGNDTKSAALWINEKELSKLLKDAGESSLVDLSIDGDKKTRPALLRNVQHNGTKPGYLHVEIQQVNLREKITVNIPIEVTGESAAVAEGRGVLETPTSEIEIEALPNDLIENITIDINVLKEIGDEIRVKDLQIPKGIEILTDAETMLAHVVEPAAEEVVETPVSEEQQVEGVDSADQSEESPDAEKKE
jgi:large subunit ribosomal protein L25